MGNAVAKCTPPPVREHAEAAVAAAGYPPTSRIEQWMQVSGANVLKQRSPQPYRFWTLQDVCSKDALQIEKDVPRANSDLGKSRQPALRRILRAHACRRRDIGYTQGLNIVVAELLLVERVLNPTTEESCFWLLCAVTDRLLPGYFTASLGGVEVDALVLEALVREHPTLSDIVPLLESVGVEDLAMVSTPWLMVMFANALPTTQLLRVWDLVFTVGARGVLAVGVAILTLQAPVLRQTSSIEEVLQLLTTLKRAAAPGSGAEVLPTEALMAAAVQALRSISPARVEALRVDVRRSKHIRFDVDGWQRRVGMLEAMDARRQRRLDGERPSVEVGKALASVGLDPTLPDRWLEATFLRTAVQLSQGTCVGELHVLGADGADAPLIGSYVRGLDLRGLDLDDEARRRLQKVRFRLRALEPKRSAAAARRERE